MPWKRKQCTDRAHAGRLGVERHGCNRTVLCCLPGRLNAQDGPSGHLLKKANNRQHAAVHMLTLSMLWCIPLEFTHRIRDRATKVRH